MEIPARESAEIDGGGFEKVGDRRDSIADWTIILQLLSSDK
jgi:hypothetical protein